MDARMKKEEAGKMGACFFFLRADNPNYPESILANIQRRHPEVDMGFIVDRAEELMKIWGLFINDKDSPYAIFSGKFFEKFDKHVDCDLTYAVKRAQLMLRNYYKCISALKFFDPMYSVYSVA